MVAGRHIGDRGLVEGCGGAFGFGLPEASEHVTVVSVPIRLCESRGRHVLIQINELDMSDLRHSQLDLDFGIK